MYERTRYDFNQRRFEAHRWDKIQKRTWARRQNMKWFLIGAGIVAVLWLGVSLGHTAGQACRYQDIQFQCS